MYIPGLHLFYHMVAELFSRQHHKIIEKLFPLHPLPVVYEKPGSFVSGIIGVQLVLVEARLFTAEI